MPNTVIQSATWNAVVDDVYQIFNTETPIVYGGTGAATAADARTNLGIPALINSSINGSIGALSAFNAGPTSDLTLVYRNDAAFPFVAKGPLLFGVGSYRADNTAAAVNDCYIRLTIFDTVLGTEIVTAEGMQSCPPFVMSGGAQPGTSIIYSTLTSGRNYIMRVWTRKGIAAGPVLANQIRFDAINLGV